MDLSLISYLSGIIYSYFLPFLINPLEFLYNTFNTDFILTACLIYPIGLLILAFLCISVFNFFLDTDKDNKIGNKKPSEVNR
jgi:hypothetical protein